MKRQQNSNPQRWLLTALLLSGALSTAYGADPSKLTKAQQEAAKSPPAKQPSTVDGKVSGITYEGSCSKKGVRVISRDYQEGMALGGLGTSTLEIGRDGAFQGLRVQNRWTGTGSIIRPGTFFSIHARTESGKATSKVLQLEAPEGLPPVAGLTYTGRFPFVEIAYKDASLPCQVTLNAFSPFVPQDVASSSLPLVFFTFRLRNPGSEPVTVTPALSWVNDIAAEPFPGGWPPAGNRNSLLPGPGPGVLMETRVKEIAGSEYLLACLPADGVQYSAVADWADGGGSMAAWKRFLDTGTLPPESGYDDGLDRYSRHLPTAAVAGRVRLLPGEEKEARFALVWFFPYHWDRQPSAAKIFLGHQYAVRFPKGTRDVAAWAFPQRESLLRHSGLWRSLIEDSSLPANTKALMSEIVYLLPRTSWWLADDTFVLYESINCPRMGITILNLYAAPVLSALFPDLHAKTIRAVAATQRANGEIASTLGISSIYQHEYRLFNPGDASTFPIATAWAILWGGDQRFVEEMYPVVKKVLQWGEGTLDNDRDGVPDTHGLDQGWDTFPMYGAAAYMTDAWIASLAAGEELARRLDDAEFAAWCASIRAKASATAENKLWNDNYYRLWYNAAKDTKSDVCFADQFTYGTVPASILGLSDVHPRQRIRKSLEAIWRLNVKPCKVVCRMGSNPDGTPANVARPEPGGNASQSNAFSPAVTAPLAAAAIQYGMVDEGLALAEATADVIVHREQRPWSGQLYFDSTTGHWCYGYHYSDCLVLWDVMHVLLGAHVDMLDRRLELEPPRIPVKVPLFSKLFFGQVEFVASGGGVELRLTNAAEEPSRIRTLTIQLPEGTPGGTCSVRQGTVGQLKSRQAGRAVANNVVIPAKGELRLGWR